MQDTKLLKNCSSKSIIFAPFNSSLSNFDESKTAEFEWPEEVKSLLEQKKSKIIRFSKKCRDLNREYEANNNADLDNGVYNAFVNEQEQEAERREKDLSNQEGAKVKRDLYDSSDSFGNFEEDEKGLTQSRFTEADELSIHESMQRLHELTHKPNISRQLEAEVILTPVVDATLQVFGIT